MRTHCVAALALLLPLGCGEEAGAGQVAKPEVAETQIKLDLPSPPSFQDPQPYGDGTHSVTEMRRHGAKFLEQDVKIKGFVVYNYDCVQSLGAQDAAKFPDKCKGKAPADCATMLGNAVLKDTPERCDKPHIYLGDEPNATPEKSLWVVEVPRAPREDELKVLPKEELDPMKAAFAAVPKFQLGSQVVVEGKWSTRSPRGFVNSDGLLVFGAMTLVQ